MRTLLPFLAFIICAARVWAENSPMPTGPYDDESAYLQERYRRSLSISEKDAIGLIRMVELVVSDQVDNGCWTNSSGTTSRLRAELERSGIPVATEPLALHSAFTPMLYLAVVGYRTNGLCVASAEIQVIFNTRADYGSLAYTGKIIVVPGEYVSWRKQTVLSKGAELNDPLMNLVQEWVDGLTADISAAKREQTVQAARALWPNYKPLTAREFDDLVKQETQSPP